MEENILQHFQQTISRHKDTLQDWLKSDEGNHGVHLGDTSVKEVLNVVSEFKELQQNISL
jgi:hypothetical protein